MFMIFFTTQIVISNAVLNKVKKFVDLRHTHQCHQL